MFRKTALVLLTSAATFGFAVSTAHAGGNGNVPGVRSSAAAFGAANYANYGRRTSVFNPNPSQGRLHDPYYSDNYKYLRRLGQTASIKPDKIKYPYVTAHPGTAASIKPESIQKSTGYGGTQLKPTPVSPIQEAKSKLDYPGPAKTATPGTTTPPPTGTNWNHWPHRPVWVVGSGGGSVIVTEPAPIVVGGAAPAAVAAPPVAARPVAAATSGPCTCLSKEYTQDGAVVFKDRCTNESAIYPPLQVTGQLAPQQVPQSTLAQ